MFCFPGGADEPSKQHPRALGKRGQGHDALTKAMEPTSLNLVADYQEQQEELHFDWFGIWIVGIQVFFHYM